MYLRIIKNIYKFTEGQKISCDAKYYKELIVDGFAIPWVEEPIIEEAIVEEPIIEESIIEEPIIEKPIVEKTPKKRKKS